MVQTCGACHADTIKRQELSPTKHAPVRDGKCTKCHEPHGGDAPLMFVKQSGIELCAACHAWERHSSHPIGDKSKDPRNQNLTLQCQSCHRAHGTEYAHLMPYAKATDMCVRCHDKFKR